MSDEIKEKVEVEEELTPKKKHQKEIMKLEGEVARLTKELNEANNKYLRALADMENSRKQNAKDQQYYLKYRAVPFVEKLLPSLDIYSQVIRNEQEDVKLRNYLTGFKFIYSNLMEALNSEGVKEIEVKVGDKFDETTMHAIESVYHEDLPPNTVVNVRNNAFMFIDRLIRPSQVDVSTNVKPTNEEVDPNSLN